MAAGVTAADDVMMCNIGTRLSGPNDLVQDRGSYVFFQNFEFTGERH